MVFKKYCTITKNVAYMFSGSMSIKDSLIEDIAGKNGAFGGRMLSVDISPFSYELSERKS